MLITLPGAERLIEKLFYAIQGLRTTAELPSHHRSSRKYLSRDVTELLNRYPKGINVEAVGILLERVIEQPQDEESIWSAVYGLFYPATPRSKNTSPIMVGDRFVGDLYDAWRCPYFEDSMVALRQQMQHCINDESAYYAKTLVFVQSSGMGKSRLADTFGESCPMINFVLREDEGYPPGDSEILTFMRQDPPKDFSDDVFNSPSKPKSGGENPVAFAKRRTAAIWNHSIAVGLLQASFETCEFRALHAFAAYANAKSVLVNTWVKKHHNATKTTIEDLAAIRHKEMAPLDPRAEVTEDPGDGRRQTRIDFCQTVPAKQIELLVDWPWTGHGGHVSYTKTNLMFVSQ